MFLLVEFTDNHEIEVIPSNWLDGDSCAVWPTYKSSQKLSKAARCKETPEDDWKSFPIRVLYSNSKQYLLYHIVYMLNADINQMLCTLSLF